jgi:hypothetical protein
MLVLIYSLQDLFLLKVLQQKLRWALMDPQDSCTCSARVLPQVTEDYMENLQEGLQVRFYLSVVIIPLLFMEAYLEMPTQQLY